MAKREQAALYEQLGLDHQQTHVERRGFVKPRNERRKKGTNLSVKNVIEKRKEDD